MEYLKVIDYLGYAYGYGAPFLLEGQLETPDPGCGPTDLSQVLWIYSGDTAGCIGFRVWS